MASHFPTNRKPKKVASSSEIGRDFAYRNNNEHKGVASRDIDYDVTVNFNSPTDATPFGHEWKIADDQT